MNLDYRANLLQSRFDLATRAPTGETETLQDATETSIALCKRSPDEVVRVGGGASAFWVDRYEASVWTTSNGQAGTQVGNDAGDTVTAGLPQNGQHTGRIAPVYALSVSGVLPPRYVTEFQPMEACAASGKQLPDAQQWMRAARGTSDGSGCIINGSAPRRTGQGTACASASDAQGKPRLGFPVHHCSMCHHGIRPFFGVDPVS